MRPRMVLAVAVFAAAIGALYWRQTRAEPAIVSGFVEADEIRVGSRVGGRVAQVLVAEGESVKAGAPLVRLEPYDLKESLARAEAELAAASAVRDKLAAGFRPEEVAQAEALREQANAAYQEAKAGPRKQEIEEAADSLKLAEATLELAAATHRRVESLFGTKAASREEFDRATSEHKVAAASVEVARSRLEMLKEGTRAEQIEQARARLLAAEAELELRRRGYRKEEIAEAEARASAAKALVQSIQAQLAELDIRAPIDSVVEAVDLRPGDLIAPNAPVVSLMDVGHLWVRAYVPENRLRAAPGVHDATLFGDTVHLLVDAERNEAELGAALAGGEAATDATFRAIGPSLEDVFVTLSRAEARERSSLPLVTPRELAEIQRARPPAPASPPGKPVERERPMHGLVAIGKKEFAHIRRDPTTLVFMFLIPTVQLLLFGYALNMDVKHIPTVVWNLDGGADSARLIEAFGNTERFTVVGHVADEESFRGAIRSGVAQVGIQIPPDFGDRLLRQQEATVGVLIDGSDSTVATTALSTAKMLGMVESVRRARAMGEALQIGPARDQSGRAALPIDIRPRLLYNPDLVSERFFVPGLVGVILQLVTIFLTAFSVVRERELGTLEQLFVTPVGRFGLMLGKLLPYLGIGAVESALVLNVMVFIFGVPIAGSIALLLGLLLLFLFCALGMGVLISTLAKNQIQAMQMSLLTMLPSILLSGFVFPRENMPLVMYWLSFVFPVTYFIEILRGVILRGAGLGDLVPSVVGLVICCIVLLSLSVWRFQKSLD